MRLDYNGRIDQRTAREHIGLRVITGKSRDKNVIVVLRPGANSVTDEDWNEIKDTKAVASLIATGMLRVLEAPGDKAKHSLAKVPVYEATQLVQRTTDPEVLADWISQLERSDLLRSPDLGQMWSKVLEDCRKAHKEATTDEKGNPATPRKIRLGSEAA